METVTSVDFEDDVVPTTDVRTEDWDNTVVPSGVADHVSEYLLPYEVKQYIIHFRNRLRNSIVHVETAYDEGHKKLTERFYRDQSWPSVDLIEPLLDKDEAFKLLYKELYFRHIYARLAPTVEQRLESFRNYEQLFKMLLDGKAVTQLRLPDKWLWDMIDEYIYQFQSFTKFRSKLTSRTESEISLLKSVPHAWSALSVITTLQQLITASNIRTTLKAPLSERTLPTLDMLGFFSIIGLLRLHTLFGEYTLALKVLDGLEVQKRGLHSRAPDCQVTLFYYVGFCYMMTRRYSDAVRSFANVLVYINRTQYMHTRQASGYDSIAKKRDQMLNLIAIVLSLRPRRIDDSVYKQLHEKVGDRIQRLRAGEEKAMEEMFLTGCPKFLSPSSPDQTPVDPTRHQSKLFLEEASLHLKLNACRSYLKLYSSLSLVKLATFLSMEPEKLRVFLHGCKHKLNQLVWVSGDASSGTRTPPDDIDFYISGDMIFTADVKIDRCYGEYFINQTNKLVQK